MQRFMKLILAALVATALLYADDTPVALSQAPGPLGYQQISVYSGTNLIYQCIARSSQIRVRTVTVSAASNASPVSFTATGHGFDYQGGATTTPVVKITGGTGNWTAINGVWLATPTSANAFTIAVDSTSFGALAGTLVVTTLAPSITDGVWSIQKSIYDGSNNLIWTGWAANAGGAGATDLKAGATAFNFACASRTTYSYQ